MLCLLVQLACGTLELPGMACKVYLLFRAQAFKCLPVLIGAGSGLWDGGVKGVGLGEDFGLGSPRRAGFLLWEDRRYWLCLILGQEFDEFQD